MFDKDFFRNDISKYNNFTESAIIVCFIVDCVKF